MPTEYLLYSISLAGLAAGASYHSWWVENSR
jgi:hypothetical protein